MVRPNTTSRGVASPAVTDPPADPQDWSDEEWLDWLAEGDAEAAAASGDAPPPPRSRPEHGAVATVMGAAMLGMAEAIYGPKDEAAEVVQASGRPGDDDDWLDLTLDPDHPEDSVAVVRPDRRPGGGPLD